MFRIGLEIVKSEKQGNVLLIEGIASDNLLDLDSERFSEEAIANMADAVEKGWIPIRVEHEKKFYTDIGVWKTGYVDNNKLYVKGEVDLELSLGKDVEVLMRKGKKMQMSVGGIIEEAISVFDDVLKKYITVYNKVCLKEISLTTTPANARTTLAISKSFSVETNTETVEAKTLADEYASLEKTETGVLIVWEKEELTKAKGSIDALFQKYLDGYESDGYFETSNTYCDGNELSSLDLEYIVKFVELSKEFGDLSMEMPKELADCNFARAFPEECFVYSIGRYLLHHNADYTVNSDWVKYWLWALINKAYDFWLSPKDYRKALCHLWYHWKEIARVSTVVKSKKTVEMTTEQILKACYEYKVNKTSVSRPQVSGNDLSDVEISKAASAFISLRNRGILSKHNNFLPMNTNEATVAKTEEVQTPATVEVVTKTEEVVVETPASTDATNDVAKTTEEVNTEASINKTGEESPATVTVSETVTEPENPNTEVVVPATAEVEAPVAPVVEEAVTKAVVEELISSKFDSIVKSLESLSSTVESISQSFVKSSEKDASNSAEITKSLASLSETINTQGAKISEIEKMAAPRKSVAITVEKSFQTNESVSLEKEVDRLMAIDKSLSVGAAIAQAKKNLQ